jgi:hypothetical protein
MTNYSPQNIVSILDGRAAELEDIADNLAVEAAGVSMALKELRKSLEEIAEHLTKREFEKASEAGYGELARNFVYVQRTLAGLQTAAYQKVAFVSDVARIAKAAYEDVEPFVEHQISVRRQELPRE